MSSTATPSTSDFRPDINALRALAVLVVVLYHFDVPGFSGGFVGVDVFFAISGYLMTRIIVTSVLDGRFSLAAFCAARARRIVPALAVVCVALLVYGAACMTPPDFERLARHAAGSIAFLSNFIYWRDVDYFGGSKHDQWLLHTWSLSVEWQFYLLFPVALMAVGHVWRSRRALGIAMGVMLIASLAISVVMTPTFRMPAFYLLPTRAWEMLAGGMVFMLGSAPRARWARAMPAMGLALIVTAVAVLREDRPWPGHLAVWPVVGTCLVLWANGSQGWGVRHRAVQFLGDASYSIYLWHWPLVTALHLHVPGANPGWRAAAIVASIVLGWMSLRYIEVPTRRSLGRLDLRTNGVMFGAACGLVACAAVGVWVQHGLPQRENVRLFAEAQARVQFANIGNGWCFVSNVDGQGPGTKGLTYRPSFSECHVGDRDGAVEALLWGDSHAGHYSPYVSTLAKAKGIRVHELSTAACPPLLDGRERGVNPDICAHFREEVKGSLSRYRTIVIAGRWDYYMRHGHFEARVESTLRALTAHGARVVVLGQSPLFSVALGQQYVYAAVFNRTLPERWPARGGPSEANAILKRTAASFPGVTYVEPTEGLCDGQGCRVQLDGVPVFFDADHLNILGAETLARRDQARGVDLFAAP